MLGFITRRLAQSLFVVWGILTVVFVLIRLSGDPITLFITEETPPEQIERIRQSLGLDRPLIAQYLSFVVQAARGDFGESLRFRQPAMSLVFDRLPASLELLVAAVVLSLVVAIPVGILAAVRKGSVIDGLGMGLVLLGQAVPAFWLGTMLVLLFSVELRLLPTSGRGAWLQLVLPTITLAAYMTARTARIVRSGMLDVLNLDFIRTARAKGLYESRVVMRHALKNVAVAIITVIALDVGSMLAGAIVTETLFAWPGIGRLLISAVSARDFPLVQATAVVLAVFVVLVNIVVDALYAFLDPRIRFN